jgi:hypothetical protein
MFFVGQIFEILKNTVSKKFQKNASYYLFLALDEGPPSYKRNINPIKKEHTALQNMNFFCFFSLFLPVWIQIHRPNGIRISSESGSEKLIKQIRRVRKHTESSK